jgi:hypothetical protein
VAAGDTEREAADVEDEEGGRKRRRTSEGLRARTVVEEVEEREREGGGERPTISDDVAVSLSFSL